MGKLGAAGKPMMALWNAAREVNHGGRRAYRKLRGYQGGRQGTEVTVEEALAEGADKTDIGAMVLSHDGRRIQKWIHYFEAYEDQFREYRNGFVEPGGGRRPVRLLEVGVNHGGSLQLWRKYFGPDAAVWGIDINPACAAIDDPDLQVRIGSQDDPEFLEAVVSDMGGVDIVLDDGSHIARHQAKTFKILFPLVSDGGVYAVEDLHTSYWRDFGGGYRRRGAFVEVVKEVIDDMHYWYHGRPLRQLANGQSGVSKLCVYDSIAFFHKRHTLRPMEVKVGRESF